MSIYDYKYTSIEGKPVALDDYKGKVLLVVNTATKCGFAGQFDGLEKLYKEYGDKGFSVIGFPSNQFMDQEPGENSDVAQTCKIRWGVTFPLSEKIEVRGESADPIFSYLTAQKPFEGVGKGLKAKAFEMTLRAKYGKDYSDDQIKWNFTKFLIDREGNVVKRYESPVVPEDISGDIEKLL
ncbi:MAG: glutathione peroxidase [Bifidobacteriaceae bacterium]|jgi:glutathione peroxidase|nr:glutathione peroxidase [Bifidobacteriaceae bacterium]MCI1915311.1 glutathione peroxidase [Bifidobacteriaceae bacterium]